MALSHWIRMEKASVLDKRSYMMCRLRSITNTDDAA